MFRKILFENEFCRLSVGLLGGMRVDVTASGRSHAVPQDCVHYLDRVVEHYRSLGGRIEPTDEGLAFLYEGFSGASISSADNPNFRVYFRETPQVHAEKAIAIFGKDAS
jgi:hypothetical protein